MRISDWSSDVCSSDRMAPHGAQAPARAGTLAAPTGRSPASHGIRIEASARIRLARMLCGLAVFLLPACIIATPWGLAPFVALIVRSEEHTSELQSLMRISYAVFCLKKKQQKTDNNHSENTT